jgi:hypothetical protein
MRIVSIQMQRGAKRGTYCPILATLHHFVRSRLGVEGVRRLMHLVGPGKIQNMWNDQNERGSDRPQGVAIKPGGYWFDDLPAGSTMSSGDFILSTIMNSPSRTIHFTVLFYQNPGSGPGMNVLLAGESSLGL